MSATPSDTAQSLPNFMGTQRGCHMAKPTDDNASEFSPERPSKCAEESRRFVEARTAHLLPEAKEKRRQEFNEGIVSLVQSGRIQK